MKALNAAQIKKVNGGTWIRVRLNASAARRTCGEGKVKSVDKDGFTCKD